MIRRKNRWIRQLRMPLAALGVALTTLSTLGGCASMQGGTQGDPVRMSESEVDIAADLWRVRNQPREALKHGLQAIDYDPENADAHYLVTLIYLDFCQRSTIDECRLDEAEKHARAATAARENYLEAQNTLAVILVHQGKFKEAIGILRPITENILYPTPEIAWGNLGWAYLRMGEPKLAIDALRRAVAAQPLFCVGNYRLGLAFRRAGQLQDAREAFNRALDTDAPGCGQLQDAYLERARTHLALGEIDQTRSDLDRCVSLQRGTPTGKECDHLLSTL